MGFLGTAAEPFESPSWLDADLDQLRAFGFDVRLLKLTDDLADIGALYIAGGNTYYLLQELRRSEADRAVVEFVENGGIYVGLSAGAIVAGPDIEPVAEPNQRAAAPLLKSTEGLGLVAFSVLPHAGQDSERFVSHHSRVMNRQFDQSIWRITNDEALLVRGGEISLVRAPRSGRD